MRKELRSKNIKRKGKERKKEKKRKLLGPSAPLVCGANSE